MLDVKGTLRARAAFAAAIVLLAMQVACGGQGVASDAAVSTSAPSSSATSSTPAPLTASTLVATLQQNGIIPVLDQSTSIAGTDANGNGVRDDIDAWIASLPDTTVQKAALTQEAKVLQQTLLVDTTSQSAVQAVGDQMGRGVGCIMVQYAAAQVPPSGIDPGYTRGSELQKYTVNTPERLAAYEKFNAASGGSVTTIDRRNACDQ